MNNNELFYSSIFIIICILVPILSIESFLVWVVAIIFCSKCLKAMKKNNKNIKSKIVTCTCFCLINIIFGVLFNIAISKGTDFIISKLL